MENNILRSQQQSIQTAKEAAEGIVAISLMCHIGMRPNFLRYVLINSFSASVKESSGLSSPVGVIGVGGEATVDIGTPYLSSDAFQRGASR